MTLSEVRRVLKDRTAQLDTRVAGVALEECAYLESKAIPTGLGLMFARGRLVRVDVDAAGIRTVSGAGVGDTEEKIKRLYPTRMTVEPHHYVPGGHYLNFLPKDGERKYGIVFETDGEAVTSFRVGTRAAIALVEGCG